MLWTSSGHSPTPRRHAALVFDLDGTLVDSSEDIAHAANATLRELDLAERSVDDIRGFIGDGARTLIERALPADASASVDTALASFLANYEANVQVFTQPYPGIRELIVRLQGVPLAIATNKPERITNKLVAALDWSASFQVVLGGDSLPTRKPDPSMLIEICRRLGVAPADCLMIGDGPQDLQASAAVSMPSCAVSWGLQPIDRLKQAGAAYAIDEPSELLRIVAA